MEQLFNYFSSQKSDDNSFVQLSSDFNNVSKQLGLNISFPSIVLVGSQSSGKSTLVNRLIGMPLIPTGGKMVTRTPINIQLIHETTDEKIELGYYNNGVWESAKTLYYNMINFDKDMQIQIEYLTEALAGKNKNISYEEIHLRIYKKDVPNLNFIDLPGLTAIACRDKGQPDDIKEQITALITKYINNENIIMCVMPAREDLETDMALALVKKYDKKGERSIGVLTKVDLMNENSDLTCYLNNTMSNDLKLKFGYYLIKNSLKKETEREEEANFFKHKAIYMEHKSFLGIDNLIDKMNQIQMNCIHNKLPQIRSFIKDKMVLYQSKLDELGDIPDEKSKNKKFTEIINNLVTKFKHEITENSGRQIKDIFVGLRQDLNNLEPFKNCSNEVLEDIIQDGHGNHMTMHLSIHILEIVLRTKKINCFSKFEPIIEKYVNKVKELIIIKITTLVNSIQGFTDFRHSLNNIISDIIKKYTDLTTKVIHDAIEMEKNYIWTDDQEFVKGLSQLENSKTEMLRKMASLYFKIISDVLGHSIPKIIMLHLIGNISNNLYTNLNSNEELLIKLKPDKEIAVMREKWSKCLKEISIANEIIQKMKIL